MQSCTYVLGALMRSCTYVLGGMDAVMYICVRGH